MVDKLTNSILAEGHVDERYAVPAEWSEIQKAYYANTVLQSRAVAVERREVDGQRVVCLAVAAGNIRGLIPYSESAVPSKDGVAESRLLRRLVGQIVAYKVRTLDEPNGIFVASRKDALEHMSSVTWAQLEEGQKRIAVVRSVAPYRAVVDVGGIKVPLEAEEVSWGWVGDVRDHLKVGDNIHVIVTKVDREKKKLAVSRKQALPDPWQGVPQKYFVRNHYVGTVVDVVLDGASKIKPGVFVELEPGVTVRTPLMRFGSVVPGDMVLVRILKLDAERRWMSGYISRRLDLA